MPATPPSGVMTVLRRPPTWDEAKKQLGDASFMTKLIEYDKDKIDDGLLKKVAKFTVVGRRWGAGPDTGAGAGACVCRGGGGHLCVGACAVVVVAVAVLCGLGLQPSTSCEALAGIKHYSGCFAPPLVFEAATCVHAWCQVMDVALQFCAVYQAGTVA